LTEVRTSDATLHCEVDGSGEPVTVLAHGLTNNRNELAAFTPLVPGTKVRFDFRGHGRSSSPATGYRFEDFARDVDAVAAHFGATVAVGTSLGAGALGNLVCRVPDRFERMVWLLPAGLDLPFPLAGRYHELAGTLEGRSPEEALAAVLDDPGRSADYLRAPWRLELDRLLWHHEDPDGLARAIHGVVEDWPIPDRDLLRRVEIPTIIVVIEGDEIHLAEVGRILAALMPNAELLEFAGQEELFAQLPALVARISSFISGNGQGDPSVRRGAVSELEDFRRDKDESFRQHSQSPLTDEQRRSFGGLRYFPENPALVIRAPLETDGVDLDEDLVMATTTGGEQRYRRAGVIRFEVDGEPAQVTLFASRDAPELFLPFRDATSGSESYGAGRYLEVEPPGPDGIVEVDFNFAYNPYCAYNPDWSCPIPPGENWLAVPVRAGEAAFPGAHEVPAG
jgi:pimeloyl-ACP methyl ester carboxylesterase